MYSVTNFKSGKALREAVKVATDGLACYQPGPFGPDVKDGDHCCEGPHYPEPHRWYVRVQVKDGRIVKAYAR